VCVVGGEGGLCMWVCLCVYVWVWVCVGVGVVVGVGVCDFGRTKCRLSRVF